jgi:cytochrome c biogenesis protein CcmG/thiol:disulfide interchange protein DsbE
VSEPASEATSTGSESGVRPGGPDPSPLSRRWLTLLPVALFAALAVFFVFALFRGDPSDLPSTLIGKPVPQFALQSVEGLTADGRPVPGLAAADFGGGEVIVVNFFASWCVPCHAEHPILETLTSRGKVRLVGVNYKDKSADARRFLGKLGNPFDRIGADLNGRAAIEWGVYGVPETFVIDGKGRVAFKHLGPITEDSLVARVLPAIEKAKTAN